jgi:UDPglucose 6-dehydrogenase
VNLLVCGLWHLGCVTAANVSRFHPTVGWDPDPEVVAALRRGVPPISEPGLADATLAGIAAGKLSFVDDARGAAALADVLWCTFDTPVDEHDRADVEFVLGHVERLIESLRPGALVIVSSQVPVGSTARLAATARRIRPEGNIRFAVLPENLRLGGAMEIFRNPDRVVAGVDARASQRQIEAIFAPFGEISIEWMSIASAEMTKHAINAFLALSVCFINEMAELCERVGADAREVERGLRTESRIGAKAYLSPGPGFAGGTLARDLCFLEELGQRLGTTGAVVSAARVSNDVQRDWTKRKITALFGSDLQGTTIACWGLTYKPGTDTLRRSSAVEFCVAAATAGARVVAFDPLVRTLPQELSAKIELAPSAIAACRGADALVVCSECPEFRDVDPDAVIAVLRRRNVVDPKRFLEKSLRSRSAYFGIGVPSAVTRRRFRTSGGTLGSRRIARHD